MKSARSLAFLFCTCLGMFAQEQPNATPSPALAPPPSPRQAGQGGQPTRNADGTYTIRTGTRIVVLDLVAADKQGNVITDLKQEEFHVTEAGEPETILHFDAPGAYTPPAEAVIDSTAALDRIAPRAPVDIILLDEFNTRFEDMAFASYSLKKYLDRQPEKLTIPTMLIAVSLQKFDVLHDYTQSKSDVLSALDHHFATYPWQLHQGGWVSERFSLAFLTLRRVAEAVIGHPGHKNMIWIGRGFPAFNGAGQIDADQRINSAVQQCVNTLRDARVTLYTIDPAGVQVNPEATYGNGGGFPGVAADPFGGNYQFNVLAKATGGRTLYGRNDVDVEIGRAIQDGSSFYTLTYRPANSSLDPAKFRRIRVTVDRPGVSVTTREGYYLQGRPAPVNVASPSRMLLMDIGSAANSTMVYDGVPLSVNPDTENTDGFIVHIEPRGLTWSYATDATPRKAELTFLAVDFDKKGKILKQIAQVIKFAAPADVPPTGPLVRAVDYKFAFEHDPKAVRGRIVVRENRTGRIGTADVPLNGHALAQGPKQARIGQAGPWHQRDREVPRFRPTVPLAFRIQQTLSVVRISVVLLEVENAAVLIDPERTLRKGQLPS